MTAQRTPLGLWIKGSGSPNPGGQLKRVKECQLMALDATPASFRLLIAQRDDVKEDSRVRQAAAKLLIAYGIGEPPKEIRIESGGREGLSQVTVEELRAVAKLSLADDVPALLNAGDEPRDDEPEH